MIGQVFSRLTVLEELPKDKHGKPRYRCLCECGNLYDTTANRLRMGRTKQCITCVNLQIARSNTKVNMAQNQKLYFIYNSMRHRCKEDQDYGSRGIKVCDRWLEQPNGFSNFLEDMGIPEDPNLTIDRINYKLGYFKENCRWVDMTIQNHNRGKRQDSISSNYIGVSFNTKNNKWVAQICFKGKISSKYFYDEYNAAIYYDNLSEEIYGDRPNKTERKVVNPASRYLAKVSFNKETNEYIAKLTINGKRESIGSYESKEKAKDALLDFVKVLENPPQF